MTITFSNIIPHYIEYDLIQNRAVRTSDRRLILEYFDRDAGSQDTPLFPDCSPCYFSKFVTLLLGLLLENKNLRSRKLVLLMKESRNICTISVRSLTSHRKVDPSHLIRFPKSDWAIIEDVLLELGLRVILSESRRTLTYSVPHLHVTYRLLLEKDTASLQVHAQDVECLIEGLTIIGLTIDEGMFIESESSQPSKIVPDPHET